MIADHLKNVYTYVGINPKFQKVAEFLTQTDLGRLEPGVYEIDGKDIYAQVQSYQTKRAEEKKWEAHRQYIDFQYMVEGVELMGYTPLDRMQMVEYTEVNDFLELAGEGELLTFRQGHFMVLFPQDAHLPGVSVDGPKPVKKVVVKVAVNSL